MDILQWNLSIWRWWMVTLDFYIHTYENQKFRWWFFLWSLKHKVLLTKDNLAWKKLAGCKKCPFCDSEESVEHPFFYPVLLLVLYGVLCIWRTTLSPLTNITNMVGNWLNKIDKKNKAKIRIGISALYCSI
jgi:hypothetical protein